MVASQDGPATDPREEDAHQAPEHDEQERKEHLNPLNRQQRRSCSAGRRTPDEEERSDRDVPDQEGDPEPAEFRRGPLRHHSEARMSRECLGATTPEHPHGPESKQSTHRPPPCKDVGVPTPRLEAVEHPAYLPSTTSECAPQSQS